MVQTPTIRALDDPAEDPSLDASLLSHPAIPPQAPHRDLTSTAEESPGPLSRNPLDDHADHHGLGAPVDEPLTSSPVTQPILDEYELTSVVPARSALSQARDADEPVTANPDPGQGKPRSSISIPHSQSLRDPPDVAATPSGADGGSQPATQESALGIPGPEDEETNSPHALTPPQVHTVADATTNAPPSEGAAETGAVASRPPRPPANDPDGHPLRGSLAPSEPSSSVRALGAGVGDESQINPMQRDLEAGPDIPSPVEDTEERV